MNNQAKNPYIGPRTFRRDEGALFFGRDREARDLAALVASEKLVLFYAQSGAGKSSLINTRLIPELEQMLYEVLPVARLSGEAPKGVEVKNIFTYNLIRSLLQRETDPKILSNLSLPQFLNKLNVDENGYFYDQSLPTSLRATMEISTWSRALIIDQFEEIFSTHVEAWQKREDFFCQLAQAMREDPYLWVVLVMREDHIAALDPYAHLLPGGLRVRYYMERLSHDAAIQAVRNPVEHLRPYASGVAEKLVEDLSSINIQQPDGTMTTQVGQYIEPVQLQVVCYSLWEGLLEGDKITAQDLQKVGDVDQSLGKYYDQRVKEVAIAKNVKERLIREWFEKKLITTGGVRNMVLQDREHRPGELGDDIILALQSDLVRAEKRGGATWYELTHDRLVAPILERNRIWFEENLSPLQRQAALWNSHDQNDAWLFADQALVDVEKWARENQDELTDTEKEFLQECLTHQKEKEQRLEIESQKQKLIAEQKLGRQRRIITYVSIVAAVVMCFLTALSVFQSYRAEISSQAAFAANLKSQANAQIANQARETSDANAMTAAAAENAAVANEKLTRISLLAAQSNELLDKNIQVSTLIGVKMVQEYKDFQSRGTLLNTLLANPRLAQYLYGHSSAVLSVAFSPDGKTLASGGCAEQNSKGQCQKGEILLWNIATGETIGAALVRHTDSVNSVAFSPDGKTLASGSNDRTIILWNVATGEQIGQSLTGHTDSVTSVTYSPDGKTLASASADRTIILWDIETGEPIGQPLVRHTDWVNSVAFSPDGSMLASGSNDGTIIIWNIETRNPVHPPLSGHKYGVTSVAFSPDGKTLASGSYDQSIFLWDIQKGESIGSPLSKHTDTVSSVAFSPDGKTLASASADDTIILWDPETGQTIDQPLSGHTDSVTSLAFSPDGKTLASGSVDKTIILWNVLKGNAIARPLTGHAAGVTSVSFSPDGKTLASGSYDATIILWEEATGMPITQPLSGHTYGVTSIAFSPDGRTIASGSADTTVILWDVVTGKPIGQPLAKHTDWVNSVAFSPDGKMLASGSCSKQNSDGQCQQGELILWNVITQEPIQSLTGHTAGVTSVAFSPDGKLLASGSNDGTIILWDVAAREPIGHPLTGHTAGVTSVVFSPDGKMLASGSADDTIILWDPETGEAIDQPLSGHTDTITSVDFSPDGKTLASGSVDNTIILWNVIKGKTIGLSLTTPSAGVTSVDFSPDGKSLASGSADSTIILWDLDPQSWVDKACQRVGRNFTLPEWNKYFSELPHETYQAFCPQWPIELALSPTTTPTATPTNTITATSTQTSTIKNLTATVQALFTETSSPGSTALALVTDTPSKTAIPIFIFTETETPSATPTLTPLPTSTSIPTDTSLPTAIPVFYRVVNVTDPDKLNIRAGAGYKYSIIGKIPANGEGIQIIGDAVQADSAIWVPILYNGIYGWVNKYYIQKQNE